ncbi:MAG TPA: heavy metal translocating P-type ATPase [Thermoplasmataceae archaeon]|nr:heavy metal translocating P-type ATPase [Thermoplasmataceae archaeon]
MPTDPVCGMYVPDDTDLKITVEGQTYYFCSESCLNKFTSPEAEKKRLKRRLIAGWAFSIPIIIITYVLLPSSGFSEFQKNMLLLLLSAPVQFYSGFGFYEGAYHALRNRAGNMDLLIVLGSTTAFVYSTYVTFFHPIGLGNQVYFDASSFIITLILTGSFIEEKTKVRANYAASRLLSLIPPVAHLSTDQGVEDVGSDELKPGDNVVIRAGERIPADCTVVEGESEVDESAITGEQEPVLKSAGDEVYSGTVNLNGVLRARVNRSGRNSTVGQIFDLIQRAISGRTKIQRVADVFSSAFVPVVLAAGIATGLFWFFYLSSVRYPDPLEISILAFVSVIVISCPCAIGLAGPISLLIASSTAASNGLIIKNASALGRISKATLVVFDKTGTLTEGIPSVSGIEASEGFDQDKVLEVAASVEAQSNHPIAKSILLAARNRNIRVKQAEGVSEQPGKGISGIVSGRRIEIHRTASDDTPSVAVEQDGRVIGRILLSYGVRNEAGSVVRSLTADGINVAIVTGDREYEAQRVAKLLGINDVHANSSPSEKAKIIADYQERGHFVIFVGDGINDSVAMQTADVGIVIGSGSDVAKEYGDILMLNDDLRLILLALVIGRATLRKIKQNIGWAVGYNAALIPVAAGIIVPLFGLSVFSVLPIFAALAMGMSSSSVVTNSILLGGRIRREWTAVYSGILKSTAGIETGSTNLMA